MELRNPQIFSEKLTGVPHYKFELHVSKGTKKGINTCLIRLDQGTEYIRKNWNSFIKEHTSEELLEIQERKYPLTTPQEENTRLEIFKQQQLEEGAREQNLTFLEGLKIKSQVQSDMSEELLKLQEKKLELETLERIQKQQK